MDSLITREIRIKKIDILSLMFSLSIIIFLCEKVYMAPGQPTGSYSSLSTLFFLFFLIIQSFLLNNLSKRLLIFFLIASAYILFLTLLLNGDLSEAFRYISALVLFSLASEYRYAKLDVLMKYIIILGLIFTVIFNIEGRQTGFFSTSPTLFSFVILISITLLCSKNYINKLNLFYSIVGLWLIILTQSRSTTFIAVLILYLGIYNFLLKKYGKRIGKLLLIVSLLIIIVSVFISMDYVKAILFRDDGTQSTITRFFFYKYIFSQYLENSSYFLWGNGPGSSYTIISSLVGTKIPVHFDILVILYDLGIIGFVSILVIPFMLVKKFPMEGILLLMVGNLHNLIYFPVGIILVSMVSAVISHSKRNLVD